MKIAVIQHRLRESAAEDCSALVGAAKRAAELGAQFVVLPEVPSLDAGDGAAREDLYSALDTIDGLRLIPTAGPDPAGLAVVADPLAGVESLGKLALLIGDACFVGSEWVTALAQSTEMLVMCPRSENEMQAEAALEVALALSDSLAGLVIIAECDGAELGSPGHGGSAIIRLGEVVAEAGSGDDLLLASIETPLAQPEPREPFPTVPTMLSQRLSHHRGEKPDVDYPADLS